MSQTPPPGYTPPPADLPQRGDRATFSNRVDAWVTWFSTVILTQLAAIASNVYANALDAYASALSALGAKTAAETARNLAQGYRDAAATSATNAHDSELAAANSAASAAVSAAMLTATSPTDLTIATGPLAFATQAGKQFAGGVDVAAVDQANSANAVYGKVLSYSGTSLTIEVSSYTGSGLVLNWNISVVGQRGAPGPVGGIAGGSLTGAINEAKAANLASAATIDVWSGAGNYETLTGSAVITALAAAPQAGARRRLLAASTPGFTAGANLVVKGVLSGQTFTCAPGDEIEIYAETTTKFRVTILRSDGLATADGGYMQAQDQKSSGTPGGSYGSGGAHAGIEVTRTLNTTVVNTIAGASLASDRITLGAGSYEISVRAPAQYADGHRIRLWNVTDSTPALVGESTQAPTFAGGVQSHAEISGKIVIPSAKVFEVRHYTSAYSGTNDFGAPTGQPGVPEIYTSIEIKKVS